MIKDLAELVEMYDRGAWSCGDFFYMATLFVPDVAIQTVVDQLPDTLRDGFVHWLRETYDNDVSVDDFVSIGRTEGRDQMRARIEALRTWLRADSL